MTSVVRWAIQHKAAMNTIMVGILVIGFFSGMYLRREEFPRFELEIILVTVPYPGASPDEVESGVCQKIEEGIRAIEGIKKITSIAQENSGTVVIEVKDDGPSVQRVLSEIESEINRITSFPDLSEEPEIRQLTIRNPAIMVGIIGPEDASDNADLQLRDVVEHVRDDLLQIPQISTAKIQGERNYQIDIEISERTLREYGLTLKQVASLVRKQNLELPGGTIKSQGQDYLLRGKHKRLRGEEIEKIPLITRSDGVVLTVGDLGTVKDEFHDKTSISRINGQPGLAISIEAAAGEDLLAMTQAVRDYARNTALPPGYSFELWQDRSVDVSDRLELLKKNGLQGLVLVFFVLALFLELRLAFWVALGIPISVLGACGVLWHFGETLNMLSMFAFLIALGIVVDDAIVIGENIYAHHEQGKRWIQAAVDGTVEVVPSVLTSVTTTIFAFMPMFFVTGVMGKFFAVLPVAVIAMLVISLIESILILPCHLAHERKRSLFHIAREWREKQHSLFLRWTLGGLIVLLSGLWDFFIYPFRLIGQAVHWSNEHFSAWLDHFINQRYLPFLHHCLRYPAIVCSASVAFLMLSSSLVTSGTVPWIIFPKMDARFIEANVIFPDGTPKSVTDAATRKIEQAILAVNEEHEEQQGETFLKLTYRLVGQVRSSSPGGADQLTEGGHAGTVKAALVDNTLRSLTSQEIIDAWRARVGSIPGAETLTFSSISHGPGGKPIEFKLLSSPEHMSELEAAVEACKDKLATYPGVYDITDDSRPGKWELQLQIKDKAKALGVPLEDLANAVRSAYYGEEVMRLQRGRHEVKLMVRYPAEERHSLARFHELRVDSGDGIKRPITELAEINVRRGYSEINRVNQLRSISITANVDESRANAARVVQDLRNDFVPELFKTYPNLYVRWEGQQEQTRESIQSLFIGLALALLATFVLLTLEFRSYLQPLIIMAVIPFGLVGALIGHAAMGLPLTLFSVLGLVALTGVVVNDSIVLVDFINHRIEDGMTVNEAVLEAGQRRFRPVLLTSLTTIAGLLPILSETSLQAQLLIPMANSLCFGLMTATFLVLILVPVFYSLYDRLIQLQGMSDEASAVEQIPSGDDQPAIDEVLDWHDGRAAPAEVTIESPG